MTDQEKLSNSIREGIATVLETIAIVLLIFCALLLFYAVMQ